MHERAHTRFRLVILAFVALAVTFSIFSLTQVGSRPYAGFRADVAGLVVAVEPGSPADAAGLRAGDRILRIDGLAPAEALAVRPQAAVGETWLLIVERYANIELGSGEAQPRISTIDITYGRLTTRALTIQLIYQLVGVCFLIFGALAYMKLGERPGLLLALMGICIGFMFLGGTYGHFYTSQALASAVMAARVALAVMGFAFLLHFLMIFPKPKPIVERNESLALILAYGPAILTSLVALSVMARPLAMENVAPALIPLLTIFGVYYFAAGLAALLRSEWRGVMGNRRLMSDADRNI